MLVSRDKYYSSPLIMDEGEYLEKMFGAASTEFKRLYDAAKKLSFEHGINATETFRNNYLNKFLKSVGEKDRAEVENFISSLANHGDGYIYNMDVKTLPKVLQAKFGVKTVGELPQERRIILKRLGLESRNTSRIRSNYKSNEAVGASDPYGDFKRAQEAGKVGDTYGDLSDFLKKKKLSEEQHEALGEFDSAIKGWTKTPGKGIDRGMKSYNTKDAPPPATPPTPPPATPPTPPTGTGGGNPNPPVKKSKRTKGSNPPTPPPTGTGGGNPNPNPNPNNNKKPRKGKKTSSKSKSSSSSSSESSEESSSIFPWIAGISGVGIAGSGGYAAYQHFKDKK